MGVIMCRLKIIGGDNKIYIIPHMLCLKDMWADKYYKYMLDYYLH